MRALIQHVLSLRLPRGRSRWYVLAVLWTVVGFWYPGMQLADHGFRMHDIELTSLLLVGTFMFSNVSFQLTPSQDTLAYCPNAQSVILAAIFLPPELAMIAAAGVIGDFDFYKTDMPFWRAAIIVGTNMVATGVAAAAVQALPPVHAGGVLLLPAALLCAIVFELAQAAMYTVIFEAKREHGGRRFLASLRKLAIVNVSINTIAVVLITPFLTSMLLASLVFAAFQSITLLAARMSASENLHREQSVHLRDVFGRYVPSNVADQLANSDQEVRLGGEARDISVLFVDIRGFTAWAETADAETVITELNSLLGELSDAVMQADGTLDKYTGDGLMAFWGAPLEQPDHAERAWSAGVDMLMRLRDFNRERTVQGLPHFNIGIGIHSGTAVVGNVGSEQRLDYTAIGDTVNTAARIEAATKEVGSPLLISQATWDELPVDRRRSTDSAGEIMVKGKRHPITVYSLPAMQIVVDEAA